MLHRLGSLAPCLALAAAPVSRREPQLWQDDFRPSHEDEQRYRLSGAFVIKASWPPRLKAGLLCPDAFSLGYDDREFLVPPRDTLLSLAPHETHSPSYHWLPSSHP